MANSKGGATVWALLVVSSELQAETLPNQKAWAKEVASQKNWHIARFFEGVSSGKDGPRKLVRELLAEVKNLAPESRPKYILATRLDRIGRGSLVEGQVVLHELDKLGVGVFTRDQGHIQLDSAMQQLIAAAQLAVAAHENENRRDKAARVYHDRRRQGLILANRPPYGLKIAPDRKSYKPDGKTAKAVAEAFKMRTGGSGYHEIGVRLSAIAPPQKFKGGKWMEKYPDGIRVRWTQTRVKRLLENRAYVGPIVDEVTFARAQQAARTSSVDRSRDSRRKYPWPLSGSIRCYCGRTMIGSAFGGAVHRTRYYVCRGSWSTQTPRHVEDVKKPYSLRCVRADGLEAQFLALLKRLEAHPNLVARFQRQANGSPAPLRERLRELERRMASIDRKREHAWELGASGKISGDEVSERLEKLARERDDVQLRLTEVRQQLIAVEAIAKDGRDAADLLSKAAFAFERAPENNQREIARACAARLGGLYVAKDGKLSVGFVEDREPQRARRA